MSCPKSTPENGPPTRKSLRQPSFRSSQFRNQNSKWYKIYAIGKYTSKSFYKYQVRLNPTLGDRSTESRENDPKKKKKKQSAEKLPTMAIRHTTFAHRIFPILTMSFQKSNAFSKKATSSTRRFFRFIKSIAKLIRIRTRKLGKTILNAEISPTALLLEVAVSCTEIRITQGQFRWKVDNVGFS